MGHGAIREPYLSGGTIPQAAPATIQGSSDSHLGPGEGLVAAVVAGGIVRVWGADEVVERVLHVRREVDDARAALLELAPQAGRARRKASLQASLVV